MDALDSGKVAGAALDVFRSEPMTESPLFGRPNVIVTPHLGASTAEAQDRAGVQTAEQVVAALTGGVVTTAVNVARARARGPRGARALRAAVPRTSARSPSPWPPPRRSTRSRSSCSGRIAERDTRLLVTSVLLGMLEGHTEEEVNAVNAPSIAEERGIEVVTSTNASARDYTDLVRVRLHERRRRVRVAGTTLGAPEPPAPARGLGPPLQPPARGAPHPVPLRRPCPG